jgi:hypothetical protein
MLRIDIHRVFAMVAILNPKWPPKYKNPPIWNNFFQIGGSLYFGGHFGFKMAAIANQRWISITNIIIYLESQFLPNQRILYFGGHFAFKMATIANQRSSVLEEI